MSDDYILNKDKFKQAISDGYWNATGWGCEDGASIVIEELEKLIGEKLI